MSYAKLHTRLTILALSLLVAASLSLTGCQTAPSASPASFSVSSMEVGNWIEVPSDRASPYTYYLNAHETQPSTENTQWRDFVMLAQRNSSSDPQAYPIESSIVQATVDCVQRSTRINIQYHYTVPFAQGRPVQAVPGDRQFRTATENASTAFLLTQLCQ